VWVCVWVCICAFGCVWWRHSDNRRASHLRNISQGSLKKSRIFPQKSRIFPQNSPIFRIFHHKSSPQSIDDCFAVLGYIIGIAKHYRECQGTAAQNSTAKKKICAEKKKITQQLLRKIAQQLHHNFEIYHRDWFIRMHHTCIHDSCCIQGGEDSEDFSSRRWFSAKEPLILGLFSGKWPVQIRHPMVRRHPVPRTEEIGLEIITTAKISNKFSRESPYISNIANKVSRDSPKIQTIFTWVHGVPVTQMIYQEN